jgi:hypothetical protein
MLKLSTMAELPLDYQCVVAFEALDPDTGLPVAGVIIRDAVIYGNDLTASASGIPPTSAAVPLLTPVELNEQTETV